MIYHVSIETENPEKVSKAIADIWCGVASPLDRLVSGSWIAFCENDPLSAIEVFPLGTDIRRSGGTDAPWYSPYMPAAEIGSQRPSATHVALGTSRTVPEILAIIDKNGWDAKHVLRGNRFELIEMWVSDYLVVEWVPNELLEPFESTMRMTIDKVRRAEATSD